MPLFSIRRITCQAQKFAQAETGKAAHLGHPVPKVSIQKPPKRVLYNNGEATIVWTKEEMNASFKPLELAVIGKCSYGRSSLSVIRNYKLSKWAVKGELSVEFLDHKHILLRFNPYEDFLKW